MPAYTASGDPFYYLLQQVSPVGNPTEEFIADSSPPAWLCSDEHASTCSLGRRGGMEGEEQGANPSRESVLQSKAEDLARAIGLSALQRLDLAEKLLTARETRRIEQEDKDKEQERLALLEAYKLQFEAYK